MTSLLGDFPWLRWLYKSTIGRLKTIGIPKVSPIIIRIIRHDSKAFTQGLVCAPGVLYEGTGLEGFSSLREYSLVTGELDRIVEVKKFWGEGIAIFKGKLFQLTYKARVALIYSIPELKKIGELIYEGEGWGLTSNSQHLIMSNGSNTLYFRDEGFNVVRTLSVFLKNKELRGINDIQCVQDKIYANIFYDTDIFEINSETGFVERIIDCSSIIIHSKRKDFHEVLNGIAYSEERGTFFLTGKKWPKLFEIKIPLRF